MYRNMYRTSLVEYSTILKLTSILKIILKILKFNSICNIRNNINSDIITPHVDYLINNSGGIASKLKSSRVLKSSSSLYPR